MQTSNHMKFAGGVGNPIQKDKKLVLKKKKKKLLMARDY